jgi:cyclopropane-fatty-acyl-phospholipid synthase
MLVAAETPGFKDFQDLLDPVGIQLNGLGACDIRVHNPDMFRCVIRDGTLGLGEAYMDGWWDCDRIDELFCRGLNGGLEDALRKKLRFLAFHFVFRIFNRQSRKRAFMVGKRHYDIGNDLFEAILDPHMNYSCGYWSDADNLDSAQEAKMALICRKLQLKSGMRVLDVGCGWGGLSRWMSMQYEVEVTAITISQEQADLARQRCQGLPVTIELMDYRDLSGQFDRIVSVGMFEHVGRQNYANYFKIMHSLLVPGGLFLLQTIGARRHVYSVDPWIEKYIFPNGMLPPARAIVDGADKLFTIEDWHNFGADYDRTLMAWYQNFIDAWPSLSGKYGERFRRMFEYYLLTCAGAFRARENQLWQVVLSGGGISGGYQSIR